MTSYSEQIRGGVPIKVWDGHGTVPIEQQALAQTAYVSMLPIIGPHVSLMPDAHFGIGSTVGSVIPTRKALIPSAVGVDLGCGVMVIQTTLTSHDVSDNAQNLFDAISIAVPHGGARGKETGNWGEIPDNVAEVWKQISPKYHEIIGKHGKISSRNAATQLGTMGGGNHAFEVCIDQNDKVWFLLHSGSRGPGNRIGEFFIELAYKDMERLGMKLPTDRNLAYLQEGSENFDDYVEALDWAQNFARLSRELMMENAVQAVRKTIRKKFDFTCEAINVHHNYAIKENHFGEDLWITRKGAISAKKGELAVILGSMGTKSHIVRGLGNPDSFHTCSHGAGRLMSRNMAKQSITLGMHRKATEGIVCRKDRDVIDESPAAYKDIDVVMNAQTDLVEITHTLKQIVNIKG